MVPSVQHLKEAIMQSPKKLKNVSSQAALVPQTLREKKKEIIELWSQRVRANIPAARNQDDVTLQNGLAEFLDALADSIPAIPGTQSGERFASEIIYLCKQHGQQRALCTGFSLDQVIFEYRYLRLAILEVLNEPVFPMCDEVIKILEEKSIKIYQKICDLYYLQSFIYSGKDFEH